MNKLLTYMMTGLLCGQMLSARAQSISPFADFLMWHASEQPASTWANVISSTEFDPQNNEFGWSPGVRMGLTYEPTSFFDTRLYWTYFSTDSSNTIPFGPDIIAPGFFSGYVSGNFFFGATSDWTLTMNMVDLEASHDFNIKHNIILTPSIGIMGGTINQNIDTIWNADIYDATEKMSSEFWGVGPSFGISGRWNMTQELSFLADFKTALMWGRWDISDVYTRPYVPLSLTPEATQITTSLDDSALGTLMLKYFLGLQWGPKALSHVTFQLGYEMQFWSNQLRLLAFQELPTHGDLTLEGGTCGFIINF